MNRTKWILLAAALGVAAFASAQQKMAKNPITIFDFATPENVTAQEGFNPAELLRFGISERLEKTDNYQPLRFNLKSPTVQLALVEGRMTLEQTRPPFNEPVGNSWKAVEVGKKIKTPFAMAGSIDSYKYDDAKKQGSIVVSLDVYDVQGDKIMVSAAVTGEAKGTAGSNEVGVMAQAIDDAATKIYQQISEPLGVGKMTILEKTDEGKKKQISARFTKTMFAASVIGLAIIVLSMRGN